jgi:hypothetical protein
MAESIDYSLRFGSISRAPSREAVKLRMQAEAMRNRAQQALSLRPRDPWPASAAMPDEAEVEVEKYVYWDEIL